VSWFKIIPIGLEKFQNEPKSSENITECYKNIIRNILKDFTILNGTNLIQECSIMFKKSSGIFQNGFKVQIIKIDYAMI